MKGFLQIVVAPQPPDALIAEGKRLQRAAKEADNWRPVFDQLHASFSRAMEAQFASEGAFLLGTRWKPLTGPYQIARMKSTGNTKILNRTGSLRAAAVHPRPYKTKTKMYLSVKHPTAAFHQLGTKKMPRRPILAFNEALKQEWRNIVRRRMQIIVRGK